jgi:hypothetical protein
LQPPASASDACPRLGKRREATWVDPTTSSLSPSFSANNRVYVEERDPAAVPNSPAARSLRSQHRTPPSPPRPWWASAPRCRRARFQFVAARRSPTSPPGGRRSSLRRCGQGRTSGPSSSCRFGRPQHPTPAKTELPRPCSPPRWPFLLWRRRPDLPASAASFLPWPRSWPPPLKAAVVWRHPDGKIRRGWPAATAGEPMAPPLLALLTTLVGRCAPRPSSPASPSHASSHRQPPPRPASLATPPQTVLLFRRRTYTQHKHGATDPAVLPWASQVAADGGPSCCPRRPSLLPTACDMHTWILLSYIRFFC